MFTDVLILMSQMFAIIVNIFSQRYTYIHGINKDIYICDCYARTPQIVLNAGNFSSLLAKIQLVEQTEQIEKTRLLSLWLMALTPR